MHQILIAHHGIYVVENLDTSALVRDRVYEFAFYLHPTSAGGRQRIARQSSGGSVTAITVTLQQ